MAVGNVVAPIEQDWTKPADWIDISSVANNEINMLVSDGTMAFNVTTSSGTYSIDWGDGTVETGRVSGTVYQRSYVLGSGTPTSYGYTQYRIRIYGASGNITRFQVQNPTVTNATQSRGLPLLWLVMGTNNLTSIQNLAGATNAIYCSALQQVVLPPVLTGVTRMDTAFVQCTSLQQVIGLESAWGAVTTTQQMFDGCISLRRVNLPSVLPNTLTTMNGMFLGCAGITTINLPTSWPTGLTDLSSTFLGCAGLKYITLPSSWPTGLTTVASMFQGCNNLASINLPSAGFPNSVTTVASMFNGCFSLTAVDLGSNWGTGTTVANLVLGGCRVLQKVTLPSNSNNLTNVNGFFQGAAPNSAVIQSVINLDKLGSTTAQVDYGSFVSSNLYITGSVTLNGAVSRVQWNGGGATSKTVLTGLRLPNTGSLFGAASPQVNVAYTNMETGSLQTLFSDIAATSASGSATRTITITGANGTTGNTTNTMTFTSGSNIVSTTSGNVILPGYELTIPSPTLAPMNWLTVNPTIATDRLVPASGGNNIPNDKIVYFTSTPGSWAVIYKPYYVVNSDAGGFQISLTQGGAPIDISGSTAQTQVAYCASVVSYSGTSITMDTVARASGGYSATVSPLKRIDLLARGWTVTG